MQITVNDTITAAHYNSLLHDLNEFWADNYSTNTPTSAKTENSRGWGQDAFPSVSVGSAITANAVNSLINCSNLSVGHTGSGATISKVSTGQTVLASTHNAIDTNNTTLLANRLAVANSTTTSGGAAGTNSRTTTWQNAITSTVTFTFNSYNEARYFFNSGGQLRFSFGNTGTTPDSLAWRDLFDSNDMGSLVFSYYDIAQTGTRAGTIYSNSGFYELTTTATTKYNIRLDISPYTDNDLNASFYRNAAGNVITAVFLLNADDTNVKYINGTTTIYVDTRKANSASSSDPATTFSIAGPSVSIAPWTGS